MTGLEPLLVYLSLSGAAVWLVYLQKSNPHLKHAFLACSCALILVCVTMGTEEMLKILPWVLVGTLFVSAFFHVLMMKRRSKFIAASEGGY